MGIVNFALIIIGFLSFLINVNATESIKKAPIKRANQYIGYPIDKSIERLPSWFVGHDLKRIFWALNSPPLQKGEFETTAAFIARKSKLNETRLYEGLDRGSVLAFSYAISDLKFTNSTFVYDADSEEMIVSLFGDELRHASFFGWKSGNINEYLAGNAFGAKVKVSSYDYSHAYIAASAQCDFRIQISREIAPIVKKSLRALFVGRLIEPYLSEETKYVTATISNPQEGTRTSYEIKFRTEEVWLYDGYTGRIYARQIN